MFRLLLFQFLKQFIHRILKFFVILAGFACVDELQQRGEVLLLLRGFIPDVANQCTVEQPFRFDPEIFAGFFSITLCVGDDGIDQFQNIFLTADVMERIVSHGFFEIDGVQDFDLIPGIREHLSAFNNDRAFRVSTDVADLFGHLHQVGLDVKSGLTAATAADHNDVFVPSILRLENYFLDGNIPISNNFTESCGARPYAVGRKNFYFHDTPAGAEASAIIYSLAQTAKLNNLSVFKYLQAVLLYMPDYVHEPEGMEELMPWSDKMKKLCAIDTKATIGDKDGNPKISR